MKCVSCLSLSGVIPSTDFLKGSGVPLSSRGDVIVDKVGWWIEFCYKGLLKSAFTITLFLAVAKKTIPKVSSLIMCDGGKSHICWSPVAEHFFVSSCSTWRRVMECSLLEILPTFLWRCWTGTGFLLVTGRSHTSMVRITRRYTLPPIKRGKIPRLHSKTTSASYLHGQRVPKHLGISSCTRTSD